MAVLKNEFWFQAACCRGEHRLPRYLLVAWKMHSGTAFRPLLILCPSQGKLAIKRTTEFYGEKVNVQIVAYLTTKTAELRNVSLSEPLQSFRNVETICWSCNLHWSVKLFMKTAQVLCYVMWLPGILISTAIHEYRRRKVKVVLYLLRVPKWTLCFFIYSNSLIVVYF